MSTFRRIFLFLVINVLIVLTISFFVNLFGAQYFLSSYGLNLKTLMVFCLIWGMGGAFISLLLSKKMAKWLMRVKVINPNSKSSEESQLLDTIYALSKKAGLKVMPEVGIYDSPEVNAFATGPNKRSALVAVSSGLLKCFSKDEVEGVLGHEITHVANGDMITMTLLQGIVNAFVMFLARIFAFLLSSIGNKSDEKRSSGSINFFTYHLFVFLFETIFLIMGTMLIALFSRKREFRADEGGAKLAGVNKMVSALEALINTQNRKDKLFDKAAFQSLKISTPKKGGFLSLFATHPPLKERIEHLKKLNLTS